MPRRRRVCLAALVLAVPLAPLAAVAPVAAGPAAADIAATAKALSTLTLPGASIVPVSPTVLFKGKAKKARTVAVAGRAGLPNDGAGAAVVDVTSQGQVFLWSAGGSKPSTATVAGPTGVAVVRLGTGGDLTVQGGGGRVTVTLLGWLPETSDVLLVPERRVLARKLRKGSSVAVKVTDALTPSDPSAVLLRVRATKKEGEIGVGPYGPPVKVPTLTYGPSVRDTVTWVSLGSGGRVSLKNLAGPSSQVEVDVLGWATPGALTAPASTRIASGKVKANKKKMVKVPSPTGTGAAWVRLTVPSPGRAGSLWLYGEGGPAAATKLDLTQGRAGIATALLRVPASGKVTLRSKSGEALKFVLDLVARLPRNPAEDATRMVLPATTRLAGPSDVISATSTSVTLRPGTDTPPVGGHLVIAPSSDARFAGLIGKVTGVAPGAGKTVVTYADAAIHEAFVDFDTEYHGGVSADALQARPRPGDHARAAGLSDIVGIGIGNIGALECTASGIAFSALDFGLTGLYGDFSFDLSSRQAHFELGGTATATASAALSPGSVSCTLDYEFPGRIPAGWLGVGVHAGLTVSLSTTDTGTASYSASAPATIGFDYDDGDVTNLSSLDFSGTGQLDAPETTLTISPYVGLIIGFVKDLKVADATVALDLAANVVFGPHPRYVGDQCNAIRFAPTLNISAGIELEWFPDLSFSIAQIPLADIDLWRGPCLGYSGSVSFKAEESFTVPEAQATTTVEGTLEAVVSSDPSRPVERTSGGGALNLGLNSSWTADYDRSHQYSYTGAPPCGYTITDSGSGAGAHATDDEVPTKLFFDSGTYTAGAVRSYWTSFMHPADSDPVYFNINVTTQHSGGCGLDPSTSTSAVDFSIPPDANPFSGVTVAPNGNITGTDTLVVPVSGGTVTYTITYSLTAVDVPFTS